jgi:hypothetical protein
MVFGVAYKVFRTIYDGIGLVWKKDWVKKHKTNLNQAVYNYLKKIASLDNKGFVKELKKVVLGFLALLIIEAALFQNILPEDILAFYSLSLFLTVFVILIACRTHESFITLLKSLTKEAIKTSFQVIGICIAVIALIFVVIALVQNVSADALLLELQQEWINWKDLSIRLKLFTFLPFVVALTFPLMFPLLVFCIYWLSKPIIYLIQKIVRKSVDNHEEEPLKLIFWYIRLIFCFEAIAILGITILKYLN